jgi:leucyl aminopeptidase
MNKQTLLCATKLAALNMLAVSFTLTVFASTSPEKPVLADRDLLAAAGIPILAVESATNVGYAKLSEEQEASLTKLAHSLNRCGGFEMLPYSSNVDPRSPLITHVFGQLKKQSAKNAKFHPSTLAFNTVQDQPAIESAVKEVSESNIRSTVEFLAAFPEREHRSAQPNIHVAAMKTRLENMLAAATVPWKLDLISHNSTHQQTIRVRFPGAKRPGEIVVLGGHLDSINQEYWGNGQAPGADDNASGSADIIETMRILSTKTQSERTIDFFLYAGEEGGLLGSAEIAADYKKQNQDVIGVLQLDMTLFPGNGEFVLGSMTDFTSAWLRSYLETLNGIYIKAKIMDDKCGYGCSDHASWYRQGYPTLMPFEASFDGMNHNLHTSRDTIDSHSSFSHAAMFGKIALVFAMDLANSELREP